MSLPLRVLARLSGNRFVQNRLAKLVRVAQRLQGVGSGAGVSSSGEKSIFGALRKRPKTPRCIFDVGANQGQFLGLALEHVSTDEVSIHCFEPGRETFRLLSGAFSPNPRITLNNFGIGKSDGEATLHYNKAGSGLASLTKRRLNHFDINFEQLESVRIRSIDSYCLEQSIDYIDLLKIDIEGHEMDALAGARRMFDNKSIGMVTFEFGGANIDTRVFFQDFWYFFSDLGMSIYRITPSGYLYRVTSYREDHEQFKVTNFLALSEK